MADLVFLLLTVAFFAVTMGFVRLCDRVIGPDEAEPGSGVAAAVDAPPTADDADLVAGATR